MLVVICQTPRTAQDLDDSLTQARRRAWQPRRHDRTCSSVIVGMVVTADDTCTASESRGVKQRQPTIAQTNSNESASSKCSAHRLVMHNKLQHTFHKISQSWFNSLQLVYYCDGTGHDLRYRAVQSVAAGA